MIPKISLSQLLGSIDGSKNVDTDAELASTLGDVSAAAETDGVFSALLSELQQSSIVATDNIESSSANTSAKSIGSSDASDESIFPGAADKRTRFTDSPNRSPSTHNGPLFGTEIENALNESIRLDVDATVDGSQDGADLQMDGENNSDRSIETLLEASDASRVAPIESTIQPFGLERIQRHAHDKSGQRNGEQTTASEVSPEPIEEVADDSNPELNATKSGKVGKSDSQTGASTSSPENWTQATQSSWQPEQESSERGIGQHEISHESDRTSLGAQRVTTSVASEITVDAQSSSNPDGASAVDLGQGASIDVPVKTQTSAMANAQVAATDLNLAETPKVEGVQLESVQVVDVFNGGDVDESIDHSQLDPSALADENVDVSIRESIEPSVAPPLIEANSLRRAMVGTASRMSRLERLESTQNRVAEGLPLSNSVAGEVEDLNPSDMEPIEFEQEAKYDESLENTSTVKERSDTRRGVFRTDTAGSGTLQPANIGPTQPVVQAASPVVEGQVSLPAIESSANVPVPSDQSAAANVDVDNSENARYVDSILPNSSVEANEYSQSVQRQAIHALRHVAENSEAGGTLLTVRINPEELGALSVHLEKTADSLSAKIVASEAATGELLLANLDRLQDSLQSLGYEDFKLEVTHEDERTSGSYEQDSSDVNSQEHNRESEERNQGVLSRGENSADGESGSSSSQNQGRCSDGSSKSVNFIA